MLKQNPAEVIRQVLEVDGPVSVTAHGQPTGVVMVADRPAPQRWVPTDRLKTIPPLPKEEAERWQEELRRSREYEFGRDLWGDE